MKERPEKADDLLTKLLSVKWPRGRLNVALRKSKNRCNSGGVK